jgi:uncharacterized membrane protein YfbV (UPF0208 family)
MLSRAMFMPAVAIFSIISEEELAGPIVQTIFVNLKSRRDLGIVGIRTYGAFGHHTPDQRSDK